MEEKEYLHKVVVVGDIGTGKTSFVKKLVHNIFSIHYKATIGVDFALKVKKDGNVTSRLQLWDIAGQERYGNMTRVYYKEAIGAFVVIDTTRDNTIEGAKKWKHDLDNKLQWTDVYQSDVKPVILLVNKVDQLDEIARSELNYDDFCKEHGFHSWFAISSKNNIGIDEACSSMIEICKNAKIRPAEALEPINTKIEEKVPEVNVVHEDNKNIDSEEWISDFLTDIFTVVSENRIDDDEKIRILRLKDFAICFDSKMDLFRKELQSNEQLCNVAKEIHDILVDESIGHSGRIVKILNHILDYGQSRLGPKKNDQIIASGKSQLANALSILNTTERINKLEECLELCKKNPQELKSLTRIAESCIIDAKSRPLW